jgi:PAS domain S-box-containing protein
MAMAIGAVAAPASAQDSTAILVLHTYDYDAPGRFPFDTAFARAVREASDYGVDLYVETLDSHRFGSEPLAGRTRQYLREKYADKNITVVVAVYNNALAFVLDEHDPFLPNVPVAALLTGHPRSLPERVAAIFVGDVVGESVSLAFRLNPNARHVAVITGAPGARDDDSDDEVRSQLVSLGLGVPVQFLLNLPLDELLARVETLAPDGIILFDRHYLGPRGKPTSRAEAARQVTRVARAPVYVTSDQLIGTGALGGMVIRMEDEGLRLAELALRISDQGVEGSYPSESSRVPMFDWRQLRRWGIAESLLPPDSDVLFRGFGLWDQYRWYVVAAVSVTLVQTGLIAGLVMQRARRRRVEFALRESERHFHMMADTAPVLIWRSGVDQGCDFFNKPWLSFTGRTFEQESGDGWVGGVHPDDRETCLTTYQTAFKRREPFRMEYRLRRFDGEYRWVLHLGVPRSDEGGQFAGFIGSAIDITDRKLIEAQNHNLAGRLIGVQEEERARLARDLHDDVSQQLAGVAILLSGLKRKVGKPGTETKMDETIATLQERTSALAQSIRHLSHELHPSVLAHAGLVATLRRHCADIEEHHGVTVVFQAGDHLDSLPPEVALCLFRVAQEALTNVVRHAQARTVEVQLMAMNDRVELRVDDDGIGFEASERIGSGLGLRSIDERVRLTRGSLRVDSRQGQGTSLLITIPRPSTHAALHRVS